MGKKKKYKMREYKEGMKLDQDKVQAVYFRDTEFHDHEQLEKTIFDHLNLQIIKHYGTMGKLVKSEIVNRKDVDYHLGHEWVKLYYRDEIDGQIEGYLTDSGLAGSAFDKYGTERDVFVVRVKVSDNNEYITRIVEVTDELRHGFQEALEKAKNNIPQ